MTVRAGRTWREATRMVMSRCRRFSGHRPKSILLVSTVSLPTFLACNLTEDAWTHCLIAHQSYICIFIPTWRNTVTCGRDCAHALLRAP